MYVEWNAAWDELKKILEDFLTQFDPFLSDLWQHAKRFGLSVDQVAYAGQLIGDYALTPTIYVTLAMAVLFYAKLFRN